MHELAIMTEALRMAIEAAESENARRILKLRLRVGSMSGVVPDALRFSFDVANQGTLAEGARLEIESVPAAFWCGTCGKEFECEDIFSECPCCHNPSGELRRGKELEIAAVELE